MMKKVTYPRVFEVGHVLSLEDGNLLDTGDDVDVEALEGALQLLVIDTRGLRDLLLSPVHIKQKKSAR